MIRKDQATLIKAEAEFSGICRSQMCASLAIKQLCSVSLLSHFFLQLLNMANTQRYVKPAGVTGKK